MGLHAMLSASAAKRWMNCTPSAQLEKSFINEQSVYAAEGSAAHALAEHKLKRKLKRRSKRPVSNYDSDEMEEYTDDYVSFAMDIIDSAKAEASDVLVLIEQRLDFSQWVPEGFGTGDLLVVSPGRLHIVDFKYGKGIPVQAEWNPQLLLYALGAFSMFSALYDIERISMSIHQPRLSNISTWEISKNDLLLWADQDVRPRAQMAIKGEGDFLPGDWCRFCRARVKCRARADTYLELAKKEFKLPALLSDDEIESILVVANDLQKWVSDVYVYAQEQAITEHRVWDGFKIVEGRSNRKYVSEAEVAEAAAAAGYEDIYKKTLIGISEMEKLMGKKEFAEILGDLVYKPKGKLSLVPESDRRKPVQIDTAETDFKED